MQEGKGQDIYSLLVEFWLSSSIKKIKENDTEILVPQKFIENKKEREFVYNYLKNTSYFSRLRTWIYNGAPNGDDIKCFDDETNMHDKYAFFTLSYLCTIFWILEDGPYSLEDKPIFLDQIKIISEGLKNSNSETIVKGFEEILKIRKNLQQIQKACDSVNRSTSPTLKSKKTLSKEEINTELKRIGLFQDQFDVFRLFNTPNKLVDLLTDNIYDFLKQNEYSSIIGVESSGVPLAALVAYKFNIPLYILRTVPELKLLPSKAITNKAVIVDDIAITGTNLNLAEKYLTDPTNKTGIQSLKKLTLIKANPIKHIDKFFFEKKNGDKYKLKTLKNFEPVETQTSFNVDLKKDLKAYCATKNYWYSPYAYCNGIFHSVCDEFVKKIENKQIKNKCLIISTSIFGLPFASVISYKLQRPLYLFSRRPNLMLDFRQKQIDNLKKNLNEGFTSIAFVDDIFSSGATMELANRKLRDIAEDTKKDIDLDINKFVLLFLGDEKQKDLYYILEKSDLRETI